MAALTLAVAMVIWPVEKLEPPVPQPVEVITGYASAYDLAPTVGTIDYRISVGQLPPDSIDRYDVFVATNSCDYIGREAIVRHGKKKLKGIVFDCSGDVATSEWMRFSNIAAEVDHWNKDLAHEFIHVEIY